MEVVVGGPEGNKEEGKEKSKSQQKVLFATVAQNSRLRTVPTRSLNKASRGSAALGFRVAHKVAPLHKKEKENERKQNGRKKKAQPAAAIPCGEEVQRLSLRRPISTPPHELRLLG